MKSILFCVLVLMVAASCSNTSTPPAAFACIHPAVMGGSPFPLPLDAVFTPKGIVVFKGPSGEKVSLVGIVCVKVERN